MLDIANLGELCSTNSGTAMAKWPLAHDSSKVSYRYILLASPDMMFLAKAMYPFTILWLKLHLTAVQYKYRFILYIIIHTCSHVYGVNKFPSGTTMSSVRSENCSYSWLLLSRYSSLCLPVRWKYSSMIFMFYTTLNNILPPSCDSLPQNVISRSSIEGFASHEGLAP